MAAFHEPERNMVMVKKRHAYLANSANIFTLSRATNPSEIMALPSFFKHAKPKKAVIPDYTNQLDLFSEVPIDNPAPVESKQIPTTGGWNARTRPAQQLDFGALAAL